MEKGEKETLFQVYIDPPTTQPSIMKDWKRAFELTQFYSPRAGEGVKTRLPNSCHICKEIDHNTVFCGIRNLEAYQEAYNKEIQTVSQSTMEASIQNQDQKDSRAIPEKDIAFSTSR